MDSSTIYQIVFGADAQPDPWQLALMTDAWPQVLIAPTGSGKTAAVTLGWAAHRMRDPDSTPRRLIWCMPMRTLVEQTAEAVMEWFGKLADEVDESNRLPRPEDIHVLMGGVDGDSWLDKPERPAVLVGTQDMLLSRALMRGYGSSRRFGRCSFGLLHEDAQWVFDEVQLMGAGRATSAQVEAFRRSDADRARSEGLQAGLPARSLWTSATLDPQWLSTVDHCEPKPETVVQVDPGAAGDGRLARLAQAAKKLTCSQVAPTSAKKNRCHRLCRTARGRGAGSAPIRIDDARDCQSRGSGAGFVPRCLPKTVRVPAGFAVSGPYPLPLSSRRPQAGDG